MKLSTIAEKAAKELEWGILKYYYNGKHCMFGAIIHYRLGHERCLKADSTIIIDYSLDALTMSKKELEMISIDKILTKNDCERWNFTRFAKEFKKLGI
mgnify:CR=1 FL=1